MKMHTGHSHPAVTGISPHQTLMFRETLETIQALQRQRTDNDRQILSLATQLRAWPPRFIVTCARGSSDHAATFAKYLFETQLGIVTTSASPSTTSIYAAKQKMEGALYLAISQSGKSPDLVAHALAARRAGAQVVAVVNAEDSPLAAVAEIVIPLRAGPEHSVAATKSYLCALGTVLHLVARWREDDELYAALAAVPEQMHASAAVDWNPLIDGLVNAVNLFVVGRGFGLAAAQEAALKLKETCGLHAEGFSAAEVRHGPMTLVGPGFPVVFFTQADETRQGTLDVANEFRERGASVWVADPDASIPGALPVPVAHHAACAPLLAMFNFYRAANTLALRRGRNPDLPPHLSKVTATV
jgi:glucosamine--fructose-6-phosphate aminotransferase (isomerizing)